MLNNLLLRDLNLILYYHFLIQALLLSNILMFHLNQIQLFFSLLIIFNLINFILIFHALIKLNAIIIKIILFMNQALSLLLMEQRIALNALYRK